ncbi:MAG: ArsR/SmtB family transcription factor [Pseudomonadota bacterium]|jgi:ArsR family transcriptional regulator
MPDSSAKHTINAHFAVLARVLGHEHRLELIEHLAQGEKPVELLAERTGLSFANASQHLQQLRRAGLAIARREGKHVVYRLANGPVIETVAALRKLAETSMAEVRDTVSTYFNRIDAMEPVEHDELIGRLRDGTVTLLDVRPGDEYATGHIAGAIHVPLADLKKRLKQLPKTKEIIAYCRGPYCVLSFEAVRLLRERGFKARRMRDGWPEWKAAGLRTATARPR